MLLKEVDKDGGVCYTSVVDGHVSRYTEEEANVLTQLQKDCAMAVHALPDIWPGGVNVVQGRGFRVTIERS